MNTVAAFVHHILQRAHSEGLVPIEEIATRHKPKIGLLHVHFAMRKMTTTKAPENKSTTIQSANMHNTKRENRPP